MTDEEFISRYYPELILTFTKVTSPVLHCSNQSSECCICLEPCKTRLPCTHTIHQLCLLTWLDNQRSCPCCRQECQLVDQKVVDWFYVSMFSKLSERFIATFQHKVHWKAISMAQVLSERFIIKYQHKVDWANISAYQVLSEPFIKRFADKLDWIGIILHQIISEDLIETYKNKVDWVTLSYSYKLSKSFIKRFAEYLHWEGISGSDLDEELIELFQSKVDWVAISWSYQELSENFLLKYRDKLDWNGVLRRQSLSEEFIRRC